MNNLTTRKIVLGLLMTLVLAFSVQGTADAITRFTASSGDLQLHAPGDTFTVRFSVGLQSAQLKPGHKRIPSRDTAGNAVTINPTTPYYDDSDGSGFLGDAPLSYDQAHYYNEESINIAVTDATLTKVGNFDVSGAPHTMSEGGTNAARLTSSVTLTLTAADAGTVEIDITDTTDAGDRPDGVAAQLDFTVYIAPTHNDTETIERVSGAAAVDFSIGEEQINDDFTALTDVRVNYTVSGSGSVSVKIGNRRLSGGRSLTTSSAAPVYLNMGGGTNIVTTSIVGQRADRALSVPYIYSHATLTKESGDEQKGAVSSRLSNPLVVKVADGRSRPVSGVEINFTLVGGGSFVRNPNFPLNRYVPETDDSLTYGRIKTDSSGQADVFWVLGSTGDQTATATLTGATAIQANSPVFTATFGTATSTASSIAIESGDGQRADEFSLLEDPLVVVVRDQRGQRVNGAKVRFIARDGGKLDPPSGDDPGTQTSGGTSSDIIEDVDTNPSGEASVRYTPPDGGGRRTVSATLQDNPTKLVTFTVNGTPSPRTDTGTDTGTDTTTPSNTITISPSSTTGAPGGTVTVNVSSSPTGVLVTLSSNEFANTNFSPQSGITPFTSTLTLPSSTGSYEFFAFGSIAGATVSDSETITVEAAALGTLTISLVGTAVNGQQTIEVTARNADGTAPSGALAVTLTGPGISRTVDTVDGSGRAIITLPTATVSYILTVSADGYNSGTVTLTPGVGTPTPTTPTPTTPTTPTPTPTGSEPSRISISGPATRSGATVNQQLDAPLLVQVLDDNGSGVADARVIFRVISGRGKLSERGNGRAVGVQTDSRGFGRANLTPLADGTIEVRASVTGVTQTVTFTISTGSAPTPTTPGTPGTDVTPGAISPVVHVGAAQRPPMLWVDGGAIYALVGASAQRFAPGVDNAMNIAVGGSKVYWTEKTGESGGTINSANLDGTGVTELASILAVPMGIAVDATNSKLYWTNSRGRIQTANLDGSGITNVIPGGLEGAMDIALAGGNAYWTQGGNVRLVNLSGTKQIRNISTGTDAAGSLVIGGGKVYWTEMTGESGGTINSANLNGTGATQLASILATPMGIAVDGSRSNLYWTNSRGRVQSANLDGSGIRNVVSGLGSPGDMVLSNSIAAPTATTTSTTTPTTASRSKYDLNGDGTVDNTDAGLVADALGTTNARYDVNGDGTVNFLDLLLVFDNRDAGAAGAPTIVGMKLTAVQIDRIQEQIDLLIATGDRSPAAMRTLIYLQQLIATARPEKTQLLANYPNPFNPETWIPYELATDTTVKITIYNTQGVVIRTLALGHQSAGYYTGRDRAAYWDGRNAIGEQVASGIYFYQFETDDMSSMRKMVILK